MVKIILTGATGFVGERALRYYITRPEVSSIIVLSRRQLPSELSNDARVTVITHDDFKSYPTHLLKRLDGAVACIWALGLRGAPLGYKDKAYAEEVDVTYPFNAATALAQYIRPANGSAFRFVLLSGIGAELDQSKSFWLMHDTRLLKGRIEQRLRTLAQGNERLDVYTCRPFGILDKEPPWIKSLIFSVLPSVKADELVAVMLDLGLHGSDQWIWENANIQQRGVQILEA